MTGPRNPNEWKVLYTAAMLESDRTLVWEKIQMAESALREQLEALPDSLSFRAERMELEGSLNFMNLLKDNLTRGDYDVGL
jgi:hypothetical protein